MSPASVPATDPKLQDWMPRFRCRFCKDEFYRSREGRPRKVCERPPCRRMWALFRKAAERMGPCPNCYRSASLCDDHYARLSQKLAEREIFLPEFRP